MSYEFTDFARDCGIDLPFNYFELDPLYTVNFRKSGTTYFLYKDIARRRLSFLKRNPLWKSIRRYLEKSAGFSWYCWCGYKKQLRLHTALPAYPVEVKPHTSARNVPNFWQQVSRYVSTTKPVRSFHWLPFSWRTLSIQRVYTLLSYTEFIHDGYFNVEEYVQDHWGIVRELEKKHKHEYNTTITALLLKATG